MPKESRSRGRRRSSSGSSSDSYTKSKRHSRERSRRSRSRNRRNGKDSKIRRRSRDREGRRNRSRSPFYNRNSSNERKTTNSSKESQKTTDIKSNSILKLTEAEKLEAEMQKRRERIEKWRREKKKRDMEVLRATAEIEDKSNNDYLEGPKPKIRMWNLDEDEDDVETVYADANIADEEDDPLDAFMNSLNQEMRSHRSAVDSNVSKNGVIIMTGVAKKGADGGVMQLHNSYRRNKGELMEQNQDGLEYASENENEKPEGNADKLAKKGKKELSLVNHAAIDYPRMEKCFYREVPELTRMTSLEVEQYRESLEGIKVRGKNIPKPIKTWPQCGITQNILSILKRNNYDNPTPIQAQAIPAIMSGRDIIGIAKTGSGKTLAFLLPLFRNLMAQPELEDGDGPIAMILTPTRELCLQIGREVKKFSRGIRNARSICVYGGTAVSDQIAELKRGAEIVVCTPGRMIDMLAANTGRITNLRRITYIVLDEADRMFDMGFEPQVMRIINNTRPDRQMVMFSATFPRQMESLARRILVKPIEIIVGGRSVVCKDIIQSIHVLEDEAKFLKLLELLGTLVETGLALIFVDKQENADSLLKDLMIASYTSCASLHGGIDQHDRDSTISDFKNGRLKILVATSIAARGLDVKELVMVVNYDCPNHYEDYVHRCGRTGRAGNVGYAHTFITPEQGKYACEIKRAFELSECVVPTELRELWEAHLVKQALEGKTVKSGGGGYGGSGFKFDQSEATYTTEKKKFQKAAFGLHDSDDEDVELEIDEQIELLLAPKRTVKTVAAAGDASIVISSSTCQSSNTPPIPTSIGDKASAAKLELARRLASKINLKNNPNVVSQQAAASYLAGKHNQPVLSAKTVADHMAAKLNQRLNYQPAEEVEEPREIERTFKKYEEELIINDFPQQARWKVTSKEALAIISEYSDAGITVRGSYWPSGKPVPEGEKKLFLAIESANELSVQKAKVEITRMLKEELMKVQTNGMHRINKGRYKVL